MRTTQSPSQAIGNTHSVATHFTAAAERYDAHASVQKTVAKRLIRMTARSPAPQRILEIGCGSGQLTRELLDVFPAASVDAIDLSAKMIQQAQCRLPRHGRVNWAVADAATYQPAVAYQLIASSSCLHWSIPLEGTLQNLASLLDVGGRLLCSVMLRGTLAELHAARLRVAPAKPPLAQLPDAEFVCRALGDTRLKIQEGAEQSLTAHYRSAGEFLRSIHRQGLTGGDVSRASAPLNRSQIAALERDYDDHYRDDRGLVTATFRVLYLSATSPAPFTG